MGTLKPLLVRSFAKVNLGLEVLGLRQDGYHELRTLFQSIDLHDEVVLTPGGRGVRVLCDHPAVPLDGTNLAARAAESLRRHAQVTHGVEILIRKRIPVAGGLGGGSSNAAAVLLGLDRLWKLGLGADGLHPLARRLGADVPFFLVGGTALGLARGDEVYPLHAQIRAQMVVVDPALPLSTAAVFARLDRTLVPRENGLRVFRFVSSELRGAARYRLLRNDLEQAAREEAPALAGKAKRIQAILVREGALMACLSGSGSSLFGLFDDRGRARSARVALQTDGFPAYLGRTLTLQEYRQRRWGSPEREASRVGNRNG